jgi:outer membrane protein OmpA-like peptidoglycan-associated protein
VGREVERLSERTSELERLESELAYLEVAIEQKEVELRASQEKLNEVQSIAGQAEEQARLAEATASGSLLGEQVFRLEGLSFEPGRTVLTAESKAMLDQLADRLRAEDVAYYLEIQTTPEPSERGSRLAAARAQEIRRYLHVDRGLPLHAVGTVSGSDPREPAPEMASDGQALLEVESKEGSAGESQLAILVVRGQPKP